MFQEVAFTAAFDRRVRERSAPRKSNGLEGQLRAAQKRVTNATRLLVEMPDDLELRRQREADRAEVARLITTLAELADHSPRPIPNARNVGAAVASFLGVIEREAP
jgi:hypothetical protein